MTGKIYKTGFCFLIGVITGIFTVTQLVGRMPLWAAIATGAVTVTVANIGTLYLIDCYEQWQLRKGSR